MPASLSKTLASIAASTMVRTTRGSARPRMVTSAIGRAPGCNLAVFKTTSDNTTWQSSSLVSCSNRAVTFTASAQSGKYDSIAIINVTDDCITGMDTDAEPD